jgi:hypothetical protein
LDIDTEAGSGDQDHVADLAEHFAFVFGFVSFALGGGFGGVQRRTAGCWKVDELEEIGRFELRSSGNRETKGVLLESGINCTWRDY